MKPYELAPGRPRPDLPEWAVIGESAADAADAAASDLFLHALNCVRTFGDVHLAFCGGRSPVQLYRTLMLDPQYRAFPWKRAHLWVVSEPHQGPRAERLLRELIVMHSDLPDDQFHPMPTGPGAARAYEAELREHLGWRERGHDRLDYVLLGVGPDGSTAGLTPGEPDHGPALVAEAGRLHERHLTMSLSFINAARLVAVLALGEGKRPAVRARLQAGPTPAAQLKPIAGHLRWYLDTDAWQGAAP
jgi:6-phosphogluconolactonase/glucosamine-6-phosphate isomerase/deaminase